MCSVRFGLCSAPSLFGSCSVRCSCSCSCLCLCSVFVFMFVVPFYENLQILPMGNVRHFRRIRKSDIIFLKMCGFLEYLVNSCVFLNIFGSCSCLCSVFVAQFYENLQILPMGNVRHFRRIRKNDTPFLKTCVFFAELTEISIFRRR